MPVYMIRAGEHGPVKIGYSRYPEIRLGQLQISHWETLRIIRLLEGGEPEESALHGRFADHHIRGEWHHFSRSMMGDVGLVDAASTPEELPPAPDSICAGNSADASAIGARIRGLRKSLGLTQGQVAVSVGLSRASVAMIETGRDLPGRDALWRISRFFGVPFEMVSSAP